MTDEIGSGSLVGRRIAGYQVLALLGAGGMGEVYRARDTRLERDVALKVLQRDRAADPAQQVRFRREAQAASALNHPNILSVYDVGVEDGISFIVTELVDGTSLRAVVERGPMPIKELLDMATQIAEGLTAAHEADIVHRDLKPENVMVTADGRAKILDFGLALTPLPTPASNGPSHVTLTEAGLIQGTVPYMSPEQARGGAGDFRSDQFAFGLILYEMTTGTRAFRRETPVQTLSAIIADEAPPIADLSARVPAQLRWLIDRCLAKDPRQRYAATRDLAQDCRTLRDRLAETTTIAGLVPDPARRRSTTGILFVVVATIAALALGTDAWLRLRPADMPLNRFWVPPPKGSSFPSSSAFMAVSPNGRAVAYVASSAEGLNTLWVRQLDSVVPTQLSSTEGAGQPFWSADSRFIAFGVGLGQLTKRVEVSNGVVESFDEALGSGTWNADNVIVAPRRGGELYWISAAGKGGPATRVTTLDPSRAETEHIWPHFLPDGRHFLYIAVSQQAKYDGTVWVGSLDSTERRQLPIPGDANVAYAAGYLLYMKTNTLFAVPFDTDTLSVTGTKMIVAEHVDWTAGSHRAAFSVSRAGDVLAYRQIGETQLKWFRHGGQPIRTIASGGPYGNPALSSNDQKVAVNQFDPATGTYDIWVIDAAGGNPQRITSDASDELKPLWFADDSDHLVFRFNGKPSPPQPAGPAFYRKALSESGLGDLVLAGVGALASPLGWAGDDSMLYEANTANMRMDVLTLSRAGDRQPVAGLNTASSESQGQLSPDRRWIAYVSDETKKQEVYVRSFPSGPEKHLVSSHGGIEPKWARDGTELYYLAPDHYLMSVKIGAADGSPGTRTVLFETRMSTATDHGYTRNQYEVAKDGRFLVNQPDFPSAITVASGWTALLKKR